jgi:phage terminase small subunit
MHMPRRSAASFSVLSVPGNQPRLVPPADLNPPERATFVEIVAAKKPQHFEASDLPLLAAYCRAIELERHAALQLATDGYLTTEGRPSPWLAIMAQATKSMLALSTRLKLTPQSRSHSAPARPERSLSAYEKLALMESGSDETA